MGGSILAVYKMKKEWVFLILGLILLCLITNTIVTLTKRSITGRATAQQVTMNISVEISNLSIASPENITYNFSIGDPNYTIDLNVSSNLAVDSWWYSLIDLSNNITVNNTVFFTPNTTIDAVRWSNKLLVFVNDSDNDVDNENVTFYIYVPNSPPSINYIGPEIYTCEASSLSYYFNITDIDGDSLTCSISPKIPFYSEFISTVNSTAKTYRLFSGTLSKTHAGGANAGSKTYTEYILTRDSQYADSQWINITVIEINNAPSIPNISVQTVWTSGADSTFYMKAPATDTESGNQDSGNLTFNITIINSTGANVNLFNISSYGIMNFTPNESQIGVYNITVNVTDTGLINPHPNISLCGEDGSNKGATQDFSLTVTNANRAPNITSYYPTSLNFLVSGTTGLYFNISKYDADGTIPDAYWYVDNIFKEYDSGSSTDEFSYTFGCEVSGLHRVKAEITDGLLNDSVEWTIIVGYVECPGVSGGGGGGGAAVCTKKWACGDWETCRNVEESLTEGILSGEEYREAKEKCLLKKWDEKFCGFQTRICFDVNRCDPSDREKTEIQECYYTEDPNCDDGIKNCHDGACELLVDCGGPCPPCPTCSDGIQNQGEKGIDCGGPCPWSCPTESPITAQTRRRLLYSILILLIILLIYILYKIYRVLKLKRRIKRPEIRAKKIKPTQKFFIILGILLVIIILGLIFFYFYSRFNVGDFVYKKDLRNLIGEIQNTSILLNPFIHWQDGRYSRESLFSIGKVNYLDEQEIRNILKANNEQELSLYSWTSKGEATDPEMPIKTVEDLRKYTIKTTEKDCLPGFICGSWSDCEVNYNFDNIATGKLTSGQQYRYCKDYTECMSDFIYLRKCEIDAPITIKRAQSERREYLELYNTENKLIARITKEKIRGVDRLDITIIID